MRFILTLMMLINAAYAFDWQGHRGARGLYPENTLGAMETALDYPITTLEFDVVITKDKKVILSHEPWMSATICLTPQGKKIKAKEYNIYQMSYEEVLKFDCGSLAHPDFPQQKKINCTKPTLELVLTEIEKKIKKEKKSISYNIEIKSTLENEQAGFQPNYQEFTELVVTEIMKHLPESRFSLQSFDFRVLKYLHQKYPKVRLVALKYGRFEVEDISKELGFKPWVFSPWFKDLTQEKVKAWQKKGVLVIPWTVNESEDLKAVRDLGVDGIITDYPNRIEK